MKKQTQIRYDFEIRKNYSFDERDFREALQRYQEEEEEGELNYFDNFNDFVKCLFNDIFENNNTYIHFDDLDKNDQIEFKEIVKNYINDLPNTIVDLIKEEKERDIMQKYINNTRQENANKLCNKRNK